MLDYIFLDIHQFLLYNTSVIAGILKAFWGKHKKMAQIPTKIEKIIRKLLLELQENNIPVKRAILFGSYAHGNFNEWSDIDLAIVSDVFVGERFEDKKKLMPITLKISYDLDVLPFNTKDFAEEDPFVKEILETGVQII